MSTVLAPQNNPMGYNISGGTNQDFLYNDLNLVIPDYKKELVPIYGTERYSFIQELLGKTAVEDETSTRFFDHFQERRLMPHMVVAANTTTSTVVITGTANKTPARVNDVVEIASTRVLARVATVSNDGLTITLTKANTGDSLFSLGDTKMAAGEVLLCRGNINAGENSDAMSGLSPIYDRIRNTTTEIRDDHTITDKAMMEKIQIEGGKYYPLAQRAMNNRFLNSLDYVAMEGNPANNLGYSVGTTGVIGRASASGSTIGYTTGSFGFPNFQELTRALDFSGGAGEYHWLCDIKQRQEINNVIFGKFVNAGSSFMSTGGQDNAIGYGFKTFGTDAYTFHLYKNKAFNPESAFGANITLTSKRSNFGVLIPQKINTDPQTGKMFPSFQMVYQKVKGQKVYTFESGGMADSNKTTKMNLTISQIAHMGVRVFAANQFAIVEGS
jgi:hypothetical protein